jgi:hypothetical protein
MALLGKGQGHQVLALPPRPLPIPRDGWQGRPSDPDLPPMFLTCKIHEPLKKLTNKAKSLRYLHLPKYI